MSARHDGSIGNYSPRSGWNTQWRNMMHCALGGIRDGGIRNGGGGEHATLGGGLRICEIPRCGGRLLGFAEYASWVDVFSVRRTLRAIISRQNNWPAKIG
jgi:hypothetical protein